MDIVGLDLHKRECQLARKAPDGTITDRRIATSAAHLSAVFGEQPRARILLEASTESEWVARHLEALGHEVIVADPNFAPMYATRTRRTKTDKRDARALMEACDTGAYRPAHRLAEGRRHVRAELAVRDALVRTRARYATLAKTFVRRDGLRVPASASYVVPARITALPLSPSLEAELAPLLAVLRPAQRADRGVGHPLGRVGADRSDRGPPPHRAGRGARHRSGVRARRSTTSGGSRRRIPSKRTSASCRVSAVPGSGASSGTSPRRGTRGCGGCWSRRRGCVLRSTSDETAALRGWASGIAARRGKRIAAVAAGAPAGRHLFALWRDGTAYDATKIRGPRPVAVAPRRQPAGSASPASHPPFSEGDTSRRSAIAAYQ